MKVLVHCHGREVRASTGRVWDKDGNIHLSYRQFEAIGKSNIGRTYMTPAEAEFLVESAENQAHTDHDLPLPFFYPAGYPVPVADDYRHKDGFGGALHPPLTDKSFHVSDARQVEKAAALLAERQAAMDAHKEAEANGESTSEDASQTLVKRAEESAKNDTVPSRRGE